MHRLRFTTAGESHGRTLCGIIEGVPSNMKLSADDINRDLARRQKGYGRGGRMMIESDSVQILSGVRWGATLGSPVCLLIENKDWPNWEKGMSIDEADAGSIDPVLRPRPGHADLAGALKYDHDDVRNVLERSSARETAMRVALGAVAKAFLAEIGIRVYSYVLEVGPEKADLEFFFTDTNPENPSDNFSNKFFDNLFDKAEASELRCPDGDASERMKYEIDLAVKKGYSLGGVFEVVATGVPPGLGSHVQWDRRLNARLAKAIMGIQAIKGVEVGLGFEMARRPGSKVMDEIFHGPEGYYRETNNSGGIEGGMSNGMPVVLRAAMKPIPTLRRPLKSVNIQTHEPMEAAYERSDVCAVPAAAVVGEAMMALTLADEVLIKFGGDSVAEVKRNMENYLNTL